MSDERKGLPSASELGRIVACPGYLKAKAKFPHTEQKHLAYAASGEEIHDQLQQEVGDETFEWQNLTQREEWVAERCVRIRRELCKELLGQEEPEDPYVEQRFWLKKVGTECFSSRVDFAAFSHDWRKLLIVDYKSGPGIYPDATMNWQIHGSIAAMAYSVAESDPEKFDKLKTVYGAIIQPLVTVKPEILELDAAEIAPLQTQVRHALSAAKLKSPPRIPGLHCMYCPVSGACPEAQAATPLVIETRWKDQLPDLPPASIARMLPYVSVIQQRLDALKERAKDILRKDPDALPGYVLKEVAGGHEVKDVNAFAKVVSDHVGRDDLRPLMKLPVAQVRDMWVERYSKSANTTKVEAKKVWELLIEDATTQKPSHERLFRKK